MQVPLVMTVIGRDRPGLVESIARLVAQHGGNWLESRMCRLGGEFAGILRIHIDSASEAALRHDLQSLQGQGLTVIAAATQAAAEADHGRMAQLELMGQDRPGIVREISHALARQGVNVEELTTECSSAPMSGENLFKATARLRLPESCTVDMLRQDLERIGGNLLVDVTIEELS
jgi:glycine cleavage system regulatory protein